MGFMVLLYVILTRCLGMGACIASTVCIRRRIDENMRLDMVARRHFGYL